MSFLDLHLSSFRFGPLNPALRRDRLGEASERSETYDDHFDFSTLFYDVYFDHIAKEVRVICPSLLNFQRLIEESKFQIDGVGAKPVIKPLSRGNVIRFKGIDAKPANLSFDHPHFSGTVQIGARHLDLFAGKNVLFAISKDNRLDWIKDWLTYYTKTHGANGVVIYDNHSTAYSMEELGETLRSVPGIDAAAIVRAWFPFGPGGAGNTNFNSKFLHMTMVELGRQRLLMDARAVLNVDIDECVYSRSGKSVFDATVDSPEGYLRFDGEWVYAKEPFPAGFPRHADHGYTRKDGRPKVSRKWSIVPNGPSGDHLWRTHRVISRRDPTTPDFGFWHFRKISNGWDYDRSEVWSEDKMQEDARLIEAMTSVFGR